jgi:hypothetical protein
MTMLLAAAVVAGCGSATDPGPRWEASLQSQQPEYRHLMGVTVALPNGVGMKVTTSIAGAPIATRHPWQLRAGSCGAGGEMLGTSTEYPPLETSAAGVASVTTVLDAALEPGRPYHVEVRASPENPSTVIACGDLAYR